MISSLVDRLFSRLSLEFRTRFLVFNIASGLFSLGALSYLTLYTLKYDFDTLFSNHTISLTKLEEIKNNYTDNVYGALLELEKGYVTPAQAYGVMDLSEGAINRLWRDYKQPSSTKNENRFVSFIRQIHKRFFQDKTPFRIDSPLGEKAMTERIESQMESFGKGYRDLFVLFHRGETEEAQRKITVELYPLINAINTQLSQLIRHKLNIAAMDKRSTDNLYQTTLRLIIILMCLVVVVTLMLSTLILRTIENLHHTLEEKVAEKTKELQELNAGLERCIACEVQESRKKDQIMYQQARLASMGEMIQNIAHQWRQPLNALTMLIHGFKSKADKGKLDVAFVEEQVKEGLRIAKGMSETIEDFRGFFRPNKSKEPFNLLKSIRDSLSLVEALYRQSEIEVEVVADQEVWILGYNNAFAQVILNIIKNAEDILIEKAIRPKHIQITLEALKEEAVARVIIVDNGGGIPFEDVQKIFEPYFTTKHKSVGTGIGLYMSKQIIEKQMSGSIEVCNTTWRSQSDGVEYQGAKFVITIPLVSEEEGGRER